MAGFDQLPDTLLYRESRHSCGDEGPTICFRRPDEAKAMTAEDWLRWSAARDPKVAENFDTILAELKAMGEV